MLFPLVEWLSCYSLLGYCHIKSQLAARSSAFLPCWPSLIVLNYEFLQHRGLVQFIPVSRYPLQHHIQQVPNYLKLKISNLIVGSNKRLKTPKLYHQCIISGQLFIEVSNKKVKYNKLPYSS